MCNHTLNTDANIVEHLESYCYLVGDYDKINIKKNQIINLEQRDDIALRTYKSDFLLYCLRYSSTLFDRTEHQIVKIAINCNSLVVIKNMNLKNDVFTHDEKPELTDLIDNQFYKRSLTDIYEYLHENNHCYDIKFPPLGGGGLLSLVARGEQDNYLSSRPKNNILESKIYKTKYI